MEPAQSQPPAGALNESVTASGLDESRQLPIQSNINNSFNVNSNNSTLNDNRIDNRVDNSIKNVVKNITKSVPGTTEAQIRQWISSLTPAFYERQEQLIQKRAMNTGEWFLECDAVRTLMAEDGDQILSCRGIGRSRYAIFNFFSSVFYI